MKKKTNQGIWIIIAAFAMLFQSCASMESYLPYEGVVRRASDVKLFLVQPEATDPGVQSDGKKYVGNYEVSKEVTLNAEQQKSIKDLVLTEDLYVETVAKSCLHRAKYALSFEYRGIPDLTVVVSTSPCSKAYVTSKGGEEELLELPVDNDLEKLISSFN